jgi:trk system potassium uptake protein TrkA
VLQDGDQLVVAVTDDITSRVHEVVEASPRGGEH